MPHDHLNIYFNDMFLHNSILPHRRGHIDQPLQVVKIHSGFGSISEASDDKWRWWSSIVEDDLLNDAGGRLSRAQESFFDVHFMFEYTSIDL